METSPVWWQNFMHSQHFINLTEINSKLEQYNGVLKTGPLTSYIEFDSEKDLVWFKLKWA